MPFYTHEVAEALDDRYGSAKYPCGNNDARIRRGRIVRRRTARAHDAAVNR